MVVIYRTHQIKAGDAVEAALRANRFAYLAGEVRSGKTASILYALDKLNPTKPTMVFTKKAAINGWQSEIERTGFSYPITVTNFESINKYNPKEYGIVVRDECHHAAGVGRPGKLFKDMRKFAADKPLICATGTPVSETPASLYYQTAISRYSPFAQYRTFYDFFRVYGVPKSIWISGREVQQYTETKPGLMDEFHSWAIKITQADAGIKSAVVNEVHTVLVSNSVKDIVAKAVATGVTEVAGKQVVLDSDMAVRAFVHQAEYGAFVSDGEFIQTGDLSVVRYIMNEWGDGATLGIMCHYRAHRDLFEQHFKHAELYSSNAHAEGVNLSHLDTLVIVGTDFSGAKHQQRINRQANIKHGDRDIIVHHIVTDAGISKDVYEAVSQKLDYSLAAFRSQRAELLRGPLI